ncbi:hypothetical protein GE21DRAFT_7460 [Neurospora crassa]|uniref:Uncharacterized protein n=1 Tax=Neurospora crassa (strain ATCC 24698 / 74-OR23-1A / CBS 708.71 / DSM 1257 / FGSC 987) TaxID=367110 RepID=Q7S817_NEUCR|nr:hypothetical protein NCU01043 [Neurospora crassa OR74A]EAA32419.2 hypothetical protein NCU01043 [Neurospora crassa OR74A]KHE88342.1 hypothetical protein GE21DRAFT_7460 [Neurospora crassa]|eukprot:XP_961655.2 hypothetical protein NCU01043 [Neurospora crassa OR74A]
MPTPSLGPLNVAIIALHRGYYDLLLVLSAEHIQMRTTLQALRDTLRGLLALPDHLHPSNWVTETARILQEAMEVEERLDFITEMMVAVTRRIEFLEQLR